MVEKSKSLVHFGISLAASSLFVIYARGAFFLYNDYYIPSITTTGVRKTRPLQSPLAAKA